MRLIDADGINMTRIYTTRGGQTALFPGAKPPRESNANRGMEFEHELLVMHQLYRLRKLAVVEKNHCPTQIVQGGQWAKITGKAIVDFTGCLANGRFVAFDAKDCVENRIELNRLAPHQLEYLGGVHALGGLAFILVRFERKHVYRIPVDRWYEADYYRAYGKPRESVDGWKPKNRSSLVMSDMKPEWAVDGVDWIKGVVVSV